VSFKTTRSYNLWFAPGFANTIWSSLIIDCPTTMTIQRRRLESVVLSHHSISLAVAVKDNYREAVFVAHGGFNPKKVDSTEYGFGVKRCNSHYARTFCHDTLSDGKHLTTFIPTLCIVCIVGRTCVSTRFGKINFFRS
jgi:hypothetical protein